MGKKIPGKKHRTVKDPYKQRQKRLESVQFKINNPPNNADEQEIPKSLLKIMELKNTAKQSTVRKYKRKIRKPTLLSVEKLMDKEKLQKGMTKPDQFIPNLVQKPNESEKTYLRRISSMAQDLISEVEFEKKFGVQIRKNLKTGEVIEVKQLKKKSKSKKKKLSEKRKAKLNQKKESLKNIKDFNELKDTVEFGEVVCKPPDLARIKNQNININKPKFSNLLLNNVLETTPKNVKKHVVKTSRVKNF